jgi:hypothetical protein
MTATGEDAVRLLQSIDASLKALVAHLGCMTATSTLVRGTNIEPIQVDLDGKYGDPTVRAKDPRDWTGDSQLGKPFSECPPAYLDLVADRLDYFCTTEDDPKKLKYQQLDAARARGWAKRLRGGWKAPVAAPDEWESIDTSTTGFPSDAPPLDDDISF